MDHKTELQIIAILEKHDPLPGDTVAEKLAYRYLDTGHIDSFAIMGFIIELEESFGVSLLPEDTQSDEFRTAGGLVRLIEQKVKG